MVLTLR